MDFHYCPILGLQWFGNLRNFNFYLIDEAGMFPVNKEPYIKTNARISASFLTKKIKWFNYNNK